MDWEGIKTAILDRERARMGLPSRQELEEKRVLAARQAAESQSGLETAALGRERTQAEIASMPAQADQRRRLVEAQIANYGETAQPRAEPSSLLERIMAMPPEQQAAALRLHGQMNPRPDPVDRAAWQPQYDAGGNLLGFVHLGQFHPKEAMGIPGDARRPLAAGTVQELALLDNPARLPGVFRDSLKAVRAAEGENPVSAGTGVFMGNVGNAYRKFDTSGPGGDFDAARKQVRQVVYGLSGKQLNQSELQWLDSITPNLADPGVDEQINRFDAFVTALVEAKRQGISDPFSAARLGFGIQRGPGAAPAPGGAPAVGGADPLEGRTATNAAGQKIVRKGGQWVPQ